MGCHLACGSGTLHELFVPSWGLPCPLPSDWVWQREELAGDGGGRHQGQAFSFLIPHQIALGGPISYPRLLSIGGLLATACLPGFLLGGYQLYAPGPEKWLSLPSFL